MVLCARQPWVPDETEDRITVPFNIMIRGRIELFTASLNLS
jgi:hypothetical protein